MQTGTLQAILEKVADQAARKADYVTSTNNIQVRTIEGIPT